MTAEQIYSILTNFTNNLYEKKRHRPYTLHGLVERKISIQTQEEL